MYDSVYAKTSHSTTPNRPYNKTFKRKSTNPIGVAALREQVLRMGLGRYAKVVGLGGKEYSA